MKIAIVSSLEKAKQEICRVIVSTGQHVILWLAKNHHDTLVKGALNKPDLVLLEIERTDMEYVRIATDIIVTLSCPILIISSSIEKNAAKIFEVIGIGALDATNLPIQGNVGYQIEVENLLKKIEIIRLLTSNNIHNMGVCSDKFVSSLYRKDLYRKKSVRKKEPNLIAIGASAGGPNALAAILNEFPLKFPAAIVITQHLDNHYTNELVNWLQRHTVLKVKKANHEEPLKAGNVYLAGKNKHLVITSDGLLSYHFDSGKSSYRPSVDVFFNSMAKFWPYTAIGVLLTGMGKDGARGLLNLRRQGKYTIAEKKDSCAVYGMPKAAAELNAATDILPLKDIAMAIKNNIDDASLLTTCHD